MGLGTSGIAIVASMFTWWTMTKFGRRPLYISGLAATTVILLIIGGLGVPEPSTALGWATGGTCFAFKIIFYLTQGPLTYTYVAEIPSMRLRAKTVVIARAAFICSAVFMVVLTNYQINVTAWNCEWRLRLSIISFPLLPMRLLLHLPLLVTLSPPTLIDLSLLQRRYSHSEFILLHCRSH